MDAPFHIAAVRPQLVGMDEPAGVVANALENAEAGGLTEQPAFRVAVAGGWSEVRLGAGEEGLARSDAADADCRVDFERRWHARSCVVNLCRDPGGGRIQHDPERSRDAPADRR